MVKSSSKSMSIFYNWSQYVILSLLFAMRILRNSLCYNLSKITPLFARLSIQVNHSLRPESNWNICEKWNRLLKLHVILLLYNFMIPSPKVIFRVYQAGWLNTILTIYQYKKQQLFRSQQIIVKHIFTVRPVTSKII